MNYNNWVAISVLHGKKDIWTYTSFLDGIKTQLLMTAEKAETALSGLHSIEWNETYTKMGNKELWKFSK